LFSRRRLKPELQREFVSETKNILIIVNANGH
jgi:hypothetical protein